MTEKQYLRFINFFNKTKLRKLIIVIICNYFPIAVGIIYFILIFYLKILSSDLLYLSIIIPATNFMGITILRKVLNSPRPYEKLMFNPLIEHDNGKSFPSRHTSSAFIISMACMKFNTTLGIVMILIAIMIGISRIMVGIHYPKDIFWGMIISILTGYVGFFILI